MDGFVRRIFRPGVLLFAALVVTAAFLWPLLIRALPDLGRREEYRIRTSEIAVTNPPRWLPPDFVEHATLQGGLPEEMSLLDENLTREVADAFRRHPWVREVVRVEKSYPARVAVELEYRQPVAMVQSGRGMYPVDVEGVLLPPEDFSIADTQRFPVLSGVESPPRGPAGTGWGDPAVLGGARLAETLLPVWSEFELAAIRPRPPASETPEVEGNQDVTYELITGGGSRIIWGRAPGADHPGELSAEQKLGRLKDYREKFGSFDAPHGPYEIDIRHWQEISRRPLAAESASERR